MKTSKFLKGLAIALALVLTTTLWVFAEDHAPDLAVSLPEVVYNGTQQTLVSAQTTAGLPILYSTDGQTWSEEVPAATAAGEYTLWAKVESDGSYAQDAVWQGTATIQKLAAEVTVGNVVKVRGDQDPPLVVTLQGFLPQEEDAVRGGFG